MARHRILLVVLAAAFVIVAPRGTAGAVVRRAAAPACGRNLAEQLRSTDHARELIVVDAPTASTTFATMTLWREKAGCFVPAGGPWVARIGANGFSNHHLEGDDTTPTGAYGIGPVMYGNAPDPGVRYPYHRLVCGDWWNEDPASPRYNTFEHVPCGAPRSFTNGEALWQETVAYPSFAVVQYNTDPVVAGAGSGIFIHANVGGPTAGCVSVQLGELDTLLRWLDPADHPLVVLGTTGEIDRF